MASFLKGVTKFHVLFVLIILTILINTSYFFLFGFSLLLYIGFKFYKTRVSQKAKNNKSKEIWLYYNKLIDGHTMSFNKVYNVRTGIKKIKFLYMNPRMQKVIEKLYFLRYYQKDLLANIIIYTEAFCKIHYNSVIGKYDACSYIPILYDIREVIMELFIHIEFNTPNTSRIIDIPDIHHHVYKIKRELNALLHRYLIVLKHKFPECSESLFELRYN